MSDFSGLKGSTISLSGAFDPELCEQLFGASSPERRPYEYAPKGYRRPWYPIATAEIEVDDWSFGDGNYSVDFHTVTPLARGHVGLRRWWRERNCNLAA